MAWHGYAIRDVQVVAICLPTIQQVLRVLQHEMSWIPAPHLIAEVNAITLTEFPTRWREGTLATGAPVTLQNWRLQPFRA